MRGTIFCPFFVFINMDFQKIIDDFNDGEFDAELFFGDWNTFFTVLDKRGLISQIDIENTEVQNSLLIWLYGRDRKRFHEFVIDKLSDVDMDENGTIYLDLDDRSELSNFFCERSRNGISMDSIKEILSGENDTFFDYDTTDSVYRDVIED
jgi:hypothetical protein